MLLPKSEWPGSEVTVDEPPSELLLAKTPNVQTIIKNTELHDVIDKLVNHCSSLFKLKYIQVHSVANRNRLVVCSFCFVYISFNSDYVSSRLYVWKMSIAVAILGGV